MIAQHCEYNQCHRVVRLKVVKVANFMLRVFHHNKKSYETE